MSKNTQIDFNKLSKEQQEQIIATLSADVKANIVKSESRAVARQRANDAVATQQAKLNELYVCAYNVAQSASAVNLAKLREALQLERGKKTFAELAEREIKSRTANAHVKRAG